MVVSQAERTPEVTPEEKCQAFPIPASSDQDLTLYHGVQLFRTLRIVYSLDLIAPGASQWPKIVREHSETHHSSTASEFYSIFSNR